MGKNRGMVFVRENGDGIFNRTGIMTQYVTQWGRTCTPLLIVLAAMFGWMIPVSSADSNAQEEAVNIAFVSGHGEAEFTLDNVFGLSRFASHLANFRSSIFSITLDQPVSNLIDLVILAGPRQPELTDAEVGRLWVYVENGGNLLVLNDPFPSRGLPARSALNNLLWEDYGIRWRDDLVVEEWFIPQAAQTVMRGDNPPHPRYLSGLAAEAVEGHELTDALVKYGTEVFYWHARSLEVQSPALKGTPVTLLQSIGEVFGETNFDSVAPLELNIGEDVQGQLIIAAAVEDHNTASRIVVINDSEMFKNGFGLEVVNNQL